MTAWLCGAAALDLGRTLRSGQAFRWTWETAGDGATIATGVVGPHIFRLRQDSGGLSLLAPRAPDALAALRAYLGLADPGAIDRIEAALAADPILAGVLLHTRGVGILAQDPWEVLISFIISANNNIPKICRSIDHMTRALGAPLGDGAFAFPVPEQLARARPRTLAMCLLGYRAPYVRAAARLVADGRLDLDTLAKMPLGRAREILLEVPGVGEKVADCVLLFGLRHTSAFPVDVWVTRAVERLYFRGRPATARRIREFARDRFGALAGYAQQHLFCYARAQLRPAPMGRGRVRPRPRHLAPRAAGTRSSLATT